MTDRLDLDALGKLSIGVVLAIGIFYVGARFTDRYLDLVESHMVALREIETQQVAILDRIAELDAKGLAVLEARNVVTGEASQSLDRIADAIRSCQGVRP